MGIDNNHGFDFHAGGDAENIKNQWEADQQKVEKEKARAKFLMDYMKVNKMKVGDSVSYKFTITDPNVKLDPASEPKLEQDWKIESIDKGEPKTLEGLKIVLVRKLGIGEERVEVGLSNLDDIKDFFSTKE